LKIDDTSIGIINTLQANNFSVSQPVSWCFEKLSANMLRRLPNTEIIGYFRHTFFLVISGPSALFSGPLGPTFNKAHP